MDVFSGTEQFGLGSLVTINGRSGLWKVARIYHDGCLQCCPVDEFGSFDDSAIDKSWPAVDPDRVSPA
jgi:hypothetical protein